LNKVLIAKNNMMPSLKNKQKKEWAAEELDNEIDSLFDFEISSGSDSPSC
jgi:hypothetical protein